MGGGTNLSWTSTCLPALDGEVLSEDRCRAHGKLACRGWTSTNFEVKLWLVNKMRQVPTYYDIIIWYVAVYLRSIVPITNHTCSKHSLYENRTSTTKVFVKNTYGKFDTISHYFVVKNLFHKQRNPSNVVKLNTCTNFTDYCHSFVIQHSRVQSLNWLNDRLTSIYIDGASGILAESEPI